MDVYAHLYSLAERKNVRGLQLLEIAAALKSLRKHIGEVKVRQGKPTLAAQINIPGDDATWIVTGEWEDGTIDVVREHGSFPSDALVGYTPGETLQEYRDGISAGGSAVHAGRDESGSEGTGEGGPPAPGSKFRGVAYRGG